MEVLEIALEVLLVILPRQSIDARCGFLFRIEERLIEPIDV